MIPLVPDILAPLKAGISASIATKQALLADAATLQTIVAVGEVMIGAFQRRNRVFFAGNGASAGDAQHLASNFVSRFAFDRPGLPSLSLSTDTSMITAIGNDYGYDQLFRRQLEAQARPGDVFIGLTTSGSSKNVLAAFEACKSLQIASVALSGLRGDLEGTTDFVVRAPSENAARIQECHILIGHMWCSQVELALFGHLAPR